MTAMDTPDFRSDTRKPSTVAGSSSWHGRTQRGRLLVSVGGGGEKEGQHVDSGWEWGRDKRDERERLPRRQIEQVSHTDTMQCSAGAMSDGERGSLRVCD